MTEENKAEMDGFSTNNSQKSYTPKKSIFNYSSNPFNYPSILPTIDENSEISENVKLLENSYHFTLDQILKLDESKIELMSYIDINRLYESILILHYRGLVDLRTYSEYLKLKELEQIIVTALYKDVEEWRIMLSSYDKFHRVNAARIQRLRKDM